MAQQLRRLLGAGKSGDQVTTLHPRAGSAGRSRFWSQESRCSQLQRLRTEQLLAEHVATRNQQSSRPLQSELASVSTMDSISSTVGGRSRCHDDEDIRSPRLGSPVTAMQDGLLRHLHDLQQVQSQVENEVEAMEQNIFKLGDGTKGCHTACSQLLQECTCHFEECVKKLRVINKHMESVDKLSLEACRYTPSPSQKEAHASFNASARQGLVQQEASPSRSRSSTSGHAKQVSAKATNHRGRTAAASTPQVHQTVQSLPAFSEQPMESNRQQGRFNSTCSEGEDHHFFYAQTVNLPVCGGTPNMVVQQAVTSPDLLAYEDDDDKEVLFTS